jgi:hypothetical protein
MSEMPDRPASLQRRRPRPSADENVDPVSYSPPAPPKAEPVADPQDEPGKQITRPLGDLLTPTGTAALDGQPAEGITRPITDILTEAPAVRRGPGRPRGREATVQLGTRVSQSVSDLIDELTALDGSARAVLENAVRHYATHRTATDRPGDES